MFLNLSLKQKSIKVRSGDLAWEFIGPPLTDIAKDIPRLKSGKEREFDNVEVLRHLRTTCCPKFQVEFIPAN